MVEVNGEALTGWQRIDAPFSLALPLLFPVVVLAQRAVVRSARPWIWRGVLLVEVFSVGCGVLVTAFQMDFALFVEPRRLQAYRGVLGTQVACAIVGVGWRWRVPAEG